MEDGTQDSRKQEEGAKIKVYISDQNKVVEMPFDEYIKGVVAAEMPVEFEIEALKAQAVAARTYVYYKIKNGITPKDGMHNNADVCTDPKHCQAWASKERLMEKWGPAAGKNCKKIEKAVGDTRNIIITYNDSVANTVFHSNSGGKTENSEDVWEGAGEPYLRSVLSQGEDACSEYESTTAFTAKNFTELLKKEYPDLKFKEKDIFKEIEVTEYTEGGRVKTVRIGNISLKGTDFRRIFSLRSANFKIEQGEKGALKITCLGNGHGVGMSQWGANYLAKIGENYEQILKYYYIGIKMDTIQQYEIRIAKQNSPT